jgi:hypothetical protein
MITGAARIFHGTRDMLAQVTGNHTAWRYA